MESIGVMVPAEHIGKVIGKAGAGLRQIRETTGVKINVQANDGTESARRVDLMGGSAQIAAAFQMLAIKAFPDGNAQLLIPADNAGQVVGRGGENLRKVRELCHVRLNLEREPVVNLETGASERQLSLNGEASQFAVALRYVLGDRGGGAAAGMPFALPGMALMGLGPQGGLASQVKPASSNPEEIQIHVAVPDGLAGAIIGKGGEQIKQMAASTGCRVSMSSRDGGGPRHAVLQGLFGPCMSAQELLHSQIVTAAQENGQALSDFSAVFMVRKEAAGAIIGKQGASLQNVRETSGARIQLAREEAAGHRPCAISGSLQSVAHAEQMIHELSQNAAAAAPAAPLPAAAPTVAPPASAGDVMPGGMAGMLPPHPTKPGMFL